MPPTIAAMPIFGYFSLAAITDPFSVVVVSRGARALARSPLGAVRRTAILVRRFPPLNFNFDTRPDPGLRGACAASVLLIVREVSFNCSLLDYIIQDPTAEIA